MFIQKNFKDIVKLFNLQMITDEYILLNSKDNLLKVYIYEITPVVLLNYSYETQQSIISIYTEFLREFDFSFQIFIQNQKLDVDEYIENYVKFFKNDNKSQNNIFSEYLHDIKNKLLSEKIYTSIYYIIVSIENDKVNIFDLDTIIYKLNETGVKTKRVNNKNDLTTILYQCVNKENIKGDHNE